MDRFEIQVTGITKEESLEASWLMARRKFIMVAVILAVCVVSVIVVGAVNNYWLLLWFVVPLPLMAIVNDVSFRRAYKKSSIGEAVLNYAFYADGWRLSVEGQGEASVTWAETVAISETAHDFLLIARVVQGRQVMRSGNTLPKRCVSDEQMQQIRLWQQASAEKVKKAHEAAKASRKWGNK